jgi:GDP-4-dehydro-6-deoxy-D-mannose reductase|nr:GDP-mannose 4,6-dehydratase [Candidatus Krumholzibacteria bacterium]
MPNRPCNLVTGALGFVGRHLTRSLVMAGLPVVGVDRVADFEQLPPRLGDFVRQPADPAFPGFFRYEGPAGTLFYVSCSLTDPEAVSRLVQDLHPVMIYHLAAQSSAAASFDDPVGTLSNNLLGTQNLLEAVRALPEATWPVVLSVGSCEEYGPHPREAYPLTEETALNPLSPYAVSKAAQTLLCQQYVRSWGLPIITVRAFSHTGPGQDPRFAFPAFARQIAVAEAGLSSREIATGDLSAVRDFLHVKDVVCAYRLLMKDGEPGRIYNVCSGEPLTIRKGLDIMIAEARCPLTVVTDPARLRPADTPIMVGDNSKLRNETGWAPEWSMTQTLRDLLDEARKEMA